MTVLTASAATTLVHDTIPAAGRLGIVVEEIGAGHATLRLPLEGNSNHVGTMYAGALFCLAELPGGLVPLTVQEPGRYISLVTDMQIRYLAPARSDVTLDARLDPDDLMALASQVDHEGRATYSLDLEGKDDAGRIVIATQGNYQLRPSRR